MTTEKTWADYCEWPESVNQRPEIMSRNEQAMIEELRGDAAQFILPYYAKNGFYDDGCGKQWISLEGQAFAQRRLAQVNEYDRHLSTLPRLPDREAYRKRLAY